MGIDGRMNEEQQLAWVEDTSFNERPMLMTVLSHMHDRYDHNVAELLTTLQSKEELQSFLRNSIARGIVAPELD